MTNVLILAAVVLWGLSFVATKICLERLSPVEIVAGRILLAVLVLSLVAWRKKLSFKLIGERWKILLALAVILIVHLLIQIVGMKTTTATNTAWLCTTIPIFIAVLSFIFMGERLIAGQIFGIFIAAIGVVILVSRGEIGSLQFVNSYGDWLVLASCITWSIYTILGRTMKGDNPLVVTISILAISGVFVVLPVVLRTGPRIYFNLPLKHVLALIFLGIFCMGLAYWFWLEGLKRKAAGEVGAFLFLEPLSTVIAAPFLLGESLTPSLFLGGALVVLGVWTVQRRRRVPPAVFPSGLFQVKG